MEQVLAEYPAAQQEPLTGHPLATLLTHDLADDVRDLVASDSYRVTGSPGRGSWAETPWVAVFDRLVTETAQRGFYVVYLFRGDGSALYLSLSQGTTEVLNLVGRRTYLEELRRRASTFVALLSGSDLTSMAAGPIDLGGSGELTKGYEAGNIVAIRYDAGRLPGEAALQQNLDRLMDLYGVLVQSQDALAEDADPAAVEAAISAGFEAMKERWHRRSERNPRLARDAKRYHGTTCVVCGFNFEVTYGEIGVDFIEAHHLTPFSELEGRPTQLDPRTDFAVVCPNCHRMLHKRTPPLSPDELRALVRPGLTSM
jgi:5-methylcytosine-specific restriction protein A